MRKIALILLLAWGAPCQTVDATHAGGSVRLDGKWRFHAGDDLRWAQPGFDDSGWQLIDPVTHWPRDQGKGYFWLRTRVKLPAASGPLELYSSEFGPSAVYINGKLAGVYGSFPPNWVMYSGKSRAYPIPANAPEITVALRFWMHPISTVDQVTESLLIGAKPDIEQRIRADTSSAVVRNLPNHIEEALTLLLAATLFVLFAVQREQTEYLFLGLALVATFANFVISDLSVLVSLSMSLYNVLDVLSATIQTFLMIEFIFLFLRQPMPKWMRVYQVSMCFTWILILAGWAGWASAAALNIFYLIYLAPYFLVLPALLTVRWLRGSREAGLLAIPMWLLSLDSILNMLGWITFQLGMRRSYSPLIPSIHLGIVTVHMGDIWFVLFLISIGILILVRFQRIRLTQARAHAELEAARSIQEVMVPNVVAATGFRLETAYIPAQEVGGDFFQVFPGEDGSLLVVIGDVSGKGMKAAMLVSMIVGVLRRTVCETRSPARILRELNALLIGHTDDKFATCCCALFEADGSVIAANAGHLSPYCDGDEVELPPGLPLGISADAEYEQVRFAEPPGRRWVFMSDGVVEARAKSGELYGFERTRTISVQSVRQIAETARDFGQEDDITVLGIAPEAGIYA